MKENVPKPASVQPPQRPERRLANGKATGEDFGKDRGAGPGLTSPPGRYDWFTGGVPIRRENFMTGGKAPQRRHLGWERPVSGDGSPHPAVKPEAGEPVVQLKRKAVGSGGGGSNSAGGGKVTVERDEVAYSERSKPVGVESALSFEDRHLYLVRDIVVRTGDGREIHLQVQGRTDVGARTHSLDARGRTGLRMQLDVKRDDGESGSSAFQMSMEGDGGSLNQLIPLCAAGGGFDAVLLRPGAVGDDFVSALVAQADKVLGGTEGSTGMQQDVAPDGEGKAAGAGWGSDRRGDAEFIDLGPATDAGPEDKGVRPWGELTPEEKENEAWKAFWEEFSWVTVAGGILATLGLMVLLEALRENPIATAGLIGGVAVVAIVAGLYALLADLLEGRNPREVDWLKNGLVVLTGVFALAGIAMYWQRATPVVAAGGLFMLFLLAVVDVIDGVALYKSGKAAPTREAMLEQVKHAAHSAEEGIIAAGTVALAPAAKPLRKLVGRLRKPAKAGGSDGQTSKEQGEKEAVESKGSPAAVAGGVPQIDRTYLIQKGIVLDVIEGRTLLTTTARKGNFGEMRADVEMVDKGWTPRHERVTDIDANTAHGIDHIFTKPGPPEIILVVDSKFGTAKLGRLADGTRQMSDRWIQSRLYSTYGDEMADDILSKGYKAVVARVDAGGRIKYVLLNGQGKSVGKFTP